MSLLASHPTESFRNSFGLIQSKVTVGQEEGRIGLRVVLISGRLLALLADDGISRSWNRLERELVAGAHLLTG